MKTAFRSLIGAAALLVCLLGAVDSARGQEDEGFGFPLVGEEELFDLSIEDLVGVEIFSAGKKSQTIADVAAAVAVLTADDIRRSGATTIPEALRLLPGVEVARIDANKWAITIRGFNGRFANKLLVLIDGRSVYTPAFAGVYWDVQDTVLADIDRIEVIRGPGGTLWGANAVNGVINIITKPSDKTQGSHLTAGGGTEERAFTALRHGFAVAEDAHMRVHAKYFERTEFPGPDGGEGFDASEAVRAGFRFDWTPSEADEITLQGDIYDGESGARVSAASLDPPTFSTTFDATSDVRGGDLMTSWRHKFTETSHLSAKVFYDRTVRLGADFADDEIRDTFDVEIQHNTELGERHDVVWGLGYRASKDRVSNDFNAAIDPTERTADTFNAFIQDEITLLEERLRLILGAKLSHNDFTGLELQPNARVLWRVGESQTAWAAVSRAVRTPSRVEHDGRLNRFVLPPTGSGSGGPTIVALAGNRDFASEKLISYELGYRVELTETARIDLALYSNHYTDLRTFTPRTDPGTGQPVLEPESDPQPDHDVWFFDIGNDMEATANGAELFVDWRPFERWRLRSGYTILDLELDLAESARGDTISPTAGGSSPEHSVFVQSMLDLPCDLELDGTVRWVDQLPSQRIDSYASLDLRLGWRPTDELELSITGQNLLEDDHAEFSSSPLVFSEMTRVPRGVYGRMTWTP